MDLEAAQPGRSDPQSDPGPDPNPPTGGAGQPDGDGEASFADRVAALRADPVMVNMAMRLARDRDLAEDALQETWYAVVTVGNPAAIRDLRRYFSRVLRRQVVRILEQVGAQRTDDPEALIAAWVSASRGAGIRRPVSRSSPAEDGAVRMAQLAGWFLRLGQLGNGCVPGRSADPQQYRQVIVSAARNLLLAQLAGDFTSADLNQLLIRAYPDWFDRPGSGRAARDQRLSRGRRDVTGVLASVIGRGELLA